MKRQGTARSEEFASSLPGEFRPPASEFPPPSPEFPVCPPEVTVGGTEYAESGGGSDRSDSSPARDRRREKARADKFKGIVRKMGYCVAAVVSVVTLGGTLDAEPAAPPNYGEVVENNSLSCVTNATTGAGIQAKIIVRRDSRNGAQVTSVRCDKEGNFDLELAPGSYVLEISAKGYLTEYFPLEVYEGQGRVTDRFSLSPELGPGQYRIVLEWGSHPGDLDSHLFGTMDDDYTFEVWYSAKLAYHDGDVLLATLDRDDTDAYGPETTTIYRRDGTYSFKVHDYSYRGNSSSTALQDSGATVKLYTYGSATPKVYTVPQGAGTWWHVFDIDHGKLRLVNTIEP